MEVTELISDYFPTDVSVHWDESCKEMMTSLVHQMPWVTFTLGDETVDVAVD